MFKRFDEKEQVSGILQLKSSVQKGIRNKVTEDYPLIKNYIDEILPKKDLLRIIKCQGRQLFFKQRDGPFIPTLKLLHQYPFLLPWEQVDKGAIKFVLSGANIMCPGLTSAGAKMTPVSEGTIVAIMAESKQCALAIGITKMSTKNILEINKGIGIENLHYLNDGLWCMKAVKGL